MDFPSITFRLNLSEIYFTIYLEKEYNRIGSWLGLSIANSLANTMDHEIGFSSKFGGVSKF